MQDTKDCTASRLRNLLQDKHPDNFMAFSDLFALGCLLHARGDKAAGRKAIEQVLAAAAGPGVKMYLASILDNLPGNEIQFAGEIHAHLEINELFPGP